jgi:hypothetical protein
MTRNGKCVYECVWIESDTPGTWFCAYALDLYGGFTSAISIVSVGVVVSGCMSEPMAPHSPKVYKATDPPMTTSQNTRQIRFSSISVLPDCKRSISHLLEKVPYAKGDEDFEALLPWNVKHAFHLAGPPWLSSHQWFTQSYLSPMAGGPFNAARMHKSR